jgi:hypothetical protein
MAEKNNARKSRIAVLRPVLYVHLCSTSDHVVSHSAFVEKDGSATFAVVNKDEYPAGTASCWQYKVDAENSSCPYTHEASPVSQYVDDRKFKNKTGSGRSEGIGDTTRIVDE